MLTFLWGAGAATGFALIVNSTGQAIVSEAFGSDFGELFGSTISAPIVEETAKATALFAIYKWRRTELDGILDGIIYAAMVGLGFAFTENVLYYSKALAEGQNVLAGTFFARGILSPFAHPLFTSLTGIGFGAGRPHAPRQPRRCGCCSGCSRAILLHALWNSSASAAQGTGFLGVYALIMFPTFLVVLVLAIVSRDARGQGGARAAGPRGGLRRAGARRPGGPGLAGRAAPGDQGRGRPRPPGPQGALPLRRRSRVPAPPAGAGARPAAAEGRRRRRPRVRQRVWELSWQAAGQQPPQLPAQSYAWPG